MAEYRPTSSFNYHPSVVEFTVPKASYLAAHPGAHFGYIATSALVLDTGTGSDPRVLLLQRAASDSNPNKWEPPGGACDDDDESILHAAARELWEEAGLQAARISRLVGDPYNFSISIGEVRQFSFAVSIKTENGTPPAVRLNPEEHQRFVWATESEVRARNVGGIDLEFTAEEVERTVLLAFSHIQEK
ncbi:NUDIX hydrolase domain-like protein [Hypoxylon argillaceum]|nr:NUDIX hydrolase domain-like protein [Hypoxylon argillaceum]